MQVASAPKCTGGGRVRWSGSPGSSLERRAFEMNRAPCSYIATSRAVASVRGGQKRSSSVPDPYVQPPRCGQSGECTLAELESHRSAKPRDRSSARLLPVPLRAAAGLAARGVAVRGERGRQPRAMAWRSRRPSEACRRTMSGTGLLALTRTHVRATDRPHRDRIRCCCGLQPKLVV